MNSTAINQLYERLHTLKRSNTVGNVYNGSSSIYNDFSVFDDFLELLPKLYDQLPDWANAYIQIYSWQYQAFHEGLSGYYENFYGNTDYTSIQKTADFLASSNYTELSQRYGYTMFDSRQYQGTIYPKEIRERISDAETWIVNNQKCVLNFYFDILMGHQAEMVEGYGV